MARGGFSTRIEFDGLGKPRAALQKLREMGADTRPFMEDARGIFVRSILRRFETGRGPGGIPWPPSKRVRGTAVGPRGPRRPTGRTLVDTQDLQDSIRGEVGPDFVEVGSDGLKNPVKAIANQFGSHRQAVVLAHTRRITQVFGVVLKEPRTVNVRAHGMITNLPARPFVGFDDQDKEDVEEAWKERLIREFSGARGNANGR